MTDADYQNAMMVLKQIRDAVCKPAVHATALVPKWKHSCDGVCNQIDLWVPRCPHCGRPSPAATEPRP